MGGGRLGSHPSGGMNAGLVLGRKRGGEGLRSTSVGGAGTGGRPTSRGGGLRSIPPEHAAKKAIIITCGFMVGVCCPGALRSRLTSWAGFCDTTRRAVSMRSLLCCLLAYSSACVGFYRIPPDQLYRVSQTTQIQDADGDVKTLRVAKVYTTLTDGRKVAVKPKHAQELFFDPNLDETADLELAVTNAPHMRRSALVGCGVGLLAAGTIGLATSRSCSEEFIDGPNGGSFVQSSNCGVDLDDALAVFFGAGIYFCPLGSGFSLLWQRSNPVAVEVMPGPPSPKRTLILSPGLSSSR